MRAIRLLGWTLGSLVGATALLIAGFFLAAWAGSSIPRNGGGIGLSPCRRKSGLSPHFGTLAARFADGAPNPFRRCRHLQMMDAEFA